MTEYRTAPEIREVARDLIDDHHTTLESHGPRIEYVMAQSKDPAAGKDYRIRKITGINAFLAADRLPESFGHVDHELVAIEVKQFFWNKLSEAQRAGLIDHLLHQLSYDLEKGAWTIEPPEFGEFEAVIRRHGFWRPDRELQRFAAAVSEQLSLLESIEELRPDADSGIESVTISHGEKSVTLSGERS